MMTEWQRWAREWFCRGDQPTDRRFARAWLTGLAFVCLCAALGLGTDPNPPIDVRAIVVPALIGVAAFFGWVVFLLRPAPMSRYSALTGVCTGVVMIAALLVGTGRLTL